MRTVPRPLALPLVGLAMLTALTIAPHAAGAGTTGCWQKTKTTKQMDLSHLSAIGTANTVGRWCAIGVVGNAKWMAGYAETSTPTWSMSGIQAKGAGVVSGEGRVYTQFTIKESIVWYHEEHKLCPRVRGKPNGTNANDSKCTIY